MVVSIGMRLQEGPWGGGNQFGKALTAFLRARGVTVVFDLHRPDIDIILLTEPRRELRSSAFDDRDVASYRSMVNPRARVVHRVNECDERKGTTGVNARLQEANAVADVTVFISSWLKGLHEDQGMAPRHSVVILNGADAEVFHARGAQRWRGDGPLRLITHHWGANYQKGFETYEMLDALLDIPALRGVLTFTYLGNLPAGVRLKNTTVLEPRFGTALADTLRAHHVYVTGSLHEPAGMHHIEGAACGLPLVYRRSGALPEYCGAFGEGFDGPDFPKALQAVAGAYHVWVDRVRSYPFSADRMGEAYLSLFTAMIRKNPMATHCSAQGSAG